MSVVIDVKVDIRIAKRKLGKNFGRAIDKASRRALTSSAKSTKGKAISVLAKKSGLKNKRVKRQVSLRISKTKIFAIIKPASHDTNLIEFMTPAAIRRAKVRKQRRRGLRATPPGEGITAKIAGKEIFKNKAFIARGRVSRKELVFKRENEGRNSSLAAVAGLNLEDVFRGELRKLGNHARIMFKTEFNRQIKFLLTKL